MNLDDLRKAAAEADIDPTEAPSNSGFQPTDGESYLVRVEEAKRILSGKGTDGVTAFVQVVDGPDGINQKFFLNFYFSKAMSEDLIKRNLHYLEVLGVDMESYDHAKPSKQGWREGGEMLVDSDTVAQVNASYRPNKDKPESPWANHHILEVQSGANNTVNVPDEDDSDLDWDTD